MRASTVDMRELESETIEQVLQNAAHDAEGITTAEMDVDTGMAAAQTRNFQTPRGAGGSGNEFDLAPGGGVDTASTTDTNWASS